MVITSISDTRKHQNYSFVEAFFSLSIVVWCYFKGIWFIYIYLSIWLIYAPKKNIFFNLKISNTNFGQAEQLCPVALQVKLVYPYNHYIVKMVNNEYHLLTSSWTVAIYHNEVNFECNLPVFGRLFNNYSYQKLGFSNVKHINCNEKNLFYN